MKRAHTQLVKCDLIRRRLMGDSSLTIVTLDGGVVGQRNPKTARKGINNQVTNAGRKEVKRVPFATVLDLPMPCSRKRRIAETNEEETVRKAHQRV